MRRWAFGIPAYRDRLAAEDALTMRAGYGESSVAAARSEAAGFVLAGGQSSRMGRDKALVELAGQPLVAHAVSMLRQAGLPVSIAGGDASLAAFAPLIEDRKAGLGPLSGICAALASTAARVAVFVPVDLPLLPASLIAGLLAHAGATCSAITLASINGFIQTFPAIVEVGALPTLESELASGRLGCLAAFQAAAERLGQPLSVVPVEYLAQAGQLDAAANMPPFRWFLNVNRHEDLQHAESLCNALIE